MFCLTLAGSLRRSNEYSCGDNAVLGGPCESLSLMHEYSCQRQNLSIVRDVAALPDSCGFAGYMSTHVERCAVLGAATRRKRLSLCENARFDADSGSLTETRREYPAFAAFPMLRLLPLAIRRATAHRETRVQTAMTSKPRFRVLAALVPAKRCVVVNRSRPKRRSRPGRKEQRARALLGHRAPALSSSARGASDWRSPTICCRCNWRCPSDAKSAA